VKVYISAQIRRKEFGRKIPSEDLPVIARSARVALGVPIAARGLPPRTRLIKAYATSKRGPKRIVSMENPVFRTALDKYLALLESDIAAGNVEELPGGEPE
jgi:hypothetical protein